LDVKFDVLEPENKARNEALRLCKLKASKQGLQAGSAGTTPYRAVPRQKEKAATKPVPAARKQHGSSGVDTVKPSGDKPCKPGQRNDPCKPKPKIVGPGLLEGGGGFSTQGGPAGAGTAAAGGGGAGGGGGGVGVSTFRSPSNMTAPPAGGGVR
jgi:hypothetical protein